MDTLPMTMTLWQRRRLEHQCWTTPDPRVYRRTLSILEIASEKSVPLVDRLLLTPWAVYFWLIAYSRGRDAQVLSYGNRSRTVQYKFFDSVGKQHTH